MSAAMRAAAAHVYSSSDHTLPLLKMRAHEMADAVRRKSASEVSLARPENIVLGQYVCAASKDDGPQLDE